MKSRKKEAAPAAPPTTAAGPPIVEPRRMRAAAVAARVRNLVQTGQADPDLAEALVWSVHTAPAGPPAGVSEPSAPVQFEPAALEPENVVQPAAGTKGSRSTRRSSGVLGALEPNTLVSEPAVTGSIAGSKRKATGGVGEGHVAKRARGVPAAVVAPAAAEALNVAAPSAQPQPESVVSTEARASEDVTAVALPALPPSPATAPPPVAGRPQPSRPQASTGAVPQPLVDPPAASASSSSNSSNTMVDDTEAPVLPFEGVFSASSSSSLPLGHRVEGHFDPSEWDAAEAPIFMDDDNDGDNTISNVAESVASGAAPVVEAAEELVRSEAPPVPTPATVARVPVEEPVLLAAPYDPVSLPASASNIRAWVAQHASNDPCEDSWFFRVFPRAARSEAGVPAASDGASSSVGPVSQHLRLEDVDAVTFGIIDGHGNHLVSRLAAGMLPDLLYSHTAGATSVAAVEAGIIQAFVEIDEAIKARLATAGPAASIFARDWLRSGAVANAVLIKRLHGVLVLFDANLGDTRAVLAAEAALPVSQGDTSSAGAASSAVLRPSGDASAGPALTSPLLPEYPSASQPAAGLSSSQLRHEPSASQQPLRRQLFASSSQQPLAAAGVSASQPCDSASLSASAAAAAAAGVDLWWGGLPGSQPGAAAGMEAGFGSDRRGVLTSPQPGSQALGGSLPFPEPSQHPVHLRLHGGSRGVPSRSSQSLQSQHAIAATRGLVGGAGAAARGSQPAPASPGLLPPSTPRGPRLFPALSSHYFAAQAELLAQEAETTTVVAPSSSSSFNSRGDGGIAGLARALQCWSPPAPSASLSTVGLRHMGRVPAMLIRDLDDAEEELDDPAPQPLLPVLTTGGAADCASASQPELGAADPSAAAPLPLSEAWETRTVLSSYYDDGGYTPAEDKDWPLSLGGTVRDAEEEPLPQVLQRRLEQRLAASASTYTAVPLSCDHTVFNRDEVLRVARRCKDTYPVRVDPSDPAAPLPAAQLPGRRDPARLRALAMAYRLAVHDTAQRLLGQGKVRTSTGGGAAAAAPSQAEVLASPPAAALPPLGPASLATCGPLTPPQLLDAMKRLQMQQRDISALLPARLGHGETLAEARATYAGALAGTVRRGDIATAFPRVGGVLAVTRAFGDMNLKYQAFAEQYNINPRISRSVPYLSCEPEVRWRVLRPSDRFALVASDGLWDHVTNETAVAIAAAAMADLQHGVSVGGGGGGGEEATEAPPSPPPSCPLVAGVPSLEGLGRSPSAFLPVKTQQRTAAAQRGTPATATAGPASASPAATLVQQREALLGDPAQRLLGVALHEGWHMAAGQPLRPDTFPKFLAMGAEREAAARPGAKSSTKRRLLHDDMTVIVVALPWAQLAASMQQVATTEADLLRLDAEAAAGAAAPVGASDGAASAASSLGKASASSTDSGFSLSSLDTPILTAAAAAPEPVEALALACAAAAAPVVAVSELPTQVSYVVATGAAAEVRPAAPTTAASAQASKPHPPAAQSLFAPVTTVPAAAMADDGSDSTSLSPAQGQKVPLSFEPRTAPPPLPALPPPASAAAVSSSVACGATGFSFIDRDEPALLPPKPAPAAQLPRASSVSAPAAAAKGAGALGAHFAMATLSLAKQPSFTVNSSSNSNSSGGSSSVSSTGSGKGALPTKLTSFASLLGPRPAVQPASVASSGAGGRASASSSAASSLPMAAAAPPRRAGSNTGAVEEDQNIISSPEPLLRPLSVAASSVGGAALAAGVRLQLRPV